MSENDNPYKKMVQPHEEYRVKSYADALNIQNEKIYGGILQQKRWEREEQEAQERAAAMAAAEARNVYEPVPDSQLPEVTSPQWVPEPDRGYALRLGLVLAVLALADSAGITTLESPGLQVLLALVSIPLIAIMAGVLPARRDGSMMSALLAAGVWFSLWFGIDLVADVIRRPNYWANQGPQTALSVLAVVGLPLLSISLIAAFKGRASYRSRH